MKMRSKKEIEDKILEIDLRILEEKDIEVSTRAACERDALQWCLGESISLHDMSTIEFIKGGLGYVILPWDEK